MTKLLQHRLANNGALPTRMRMLYSWNLSSWTALSSTDCRLRRCRKFLRQRPVCLKRPSGRVMNLKRMLLLSQNAAVLMTRTGLCRLRAKELARLHLSLPICLLLDVSGRGGERSCHRNFTPTSDHLGPENTSVLMPNG